MENEVQSGQPQQTDNLEPSKPVEAQQTLGGEPSPQTPPIADKWKGKSADEVARAYQELEKKLGEQAREVSDSRQRLQQYDTYFLAMQAAAQTQAQQQTYPPPQAVDKEDLEVPRDWFDKPGRTIRQISERTADQKIAQLRGEMESQMAMNNFYSGRETALSKRPDLFKDVGPQVEQAIQMAYRSGALNSTSMRDPDTWYMAASALKAKSSGYNFGSITPTSPTSFESPMGVRQTSESRPVQIVDEDEDINTERMLKGFGKTRDEAMDLMRKR